MIQLKLFWVEHQDEGMVLVIKAEEISFSTTDNVPQPPSMPKIKRVGIGQPNNIINSLETTLYPDLLQSTAPCDIIAGNME